MLVIFSVLFFVLAFLQRAHYLPWLSFYSEYSMGLALVFLITHVVRKGHVPVPERFFVALAVLPLLPLVQLLWGGGYLGDALLASLYCAGFVLSYYCGFSLARYYGQRFWLAFGSLFVLSACLSVGIALYQWLDIWGMEMWFADLSGGRPYGNLIQPNHLALLIAFALAFVLYFFEIGRLSGGTTIVVVLYLMMGLALTQTRTAWLIAGFYILWRVGRSRVLGGRAPSWLGVLSLMGCYVALVFSLPFLSDSLYLSAGGRDMGIDDASRKELYTALWHAIISGPLSGYGWGQVPQAILAVSSEYPSIPASYGHNVLLDLLVWNGPIIGGGLILLFAFWGITRSWRHSSLVSHYLLLMMAFFMAFSLLEQCYAYAYFLFPLGIIMGGVDSGFYREKEEIKKGMKVASRFILSAICLLGFLALGQVWLEYRAVEEEYRIMRFEMRGYMPPEELSIENKEGITYYLTDQIADYTKFARSTRAMDASERELMRSRKVLSRYLYPPVFMRHIMNLISAEQLDEAALYLVKMHNLGREKEFQITYAQLEEVAKSDPRVANVLAKYREINSQ